MRDRREELREQDVGVQRDGRHELVKRLGRAGHPPSVVEQKPFRLQPNGEFKNLPGNPSNKRRFSGQRTLVVKPREAEDRFSGM